MIQKIKSYLHFAGINIDEGLNNIRGFSWYLKDRKLFFRQLGNSSEFARGTNIPVLSDRNANSGTIKGQYFHQDLLVAQRVFENNPVKHLDIASRIDGFVAHIAVFREIEILDIRPLESRVPNIKFVQADICSDVHLTDYADSISCLHAIEHFGLGRYGDQIDAFAHLKGLDNIYKLLKKGGKFYFSTPIGRQRIHFNSCRIFDVSYLLKLFENKYKIDSFSFVDDEGDLHRDVELNEKDISSNFGNNDGCGIFELTKL